MKVQCIYLSLYNIWYSFQTQKAQVLEIPFRHVHSAVHVWFLMNMAKTFCDIFILHLSGWELSWPFIIYRVLCIIVKLFLYSLRPLFRNSVSENCFEWDTCCVLNHMVYHNLCTLMFEINNCTCFIVKQ